MKKAHWLATLATGLVLVGFGAAMAQGPENGPPPGGRDGGAGPGGGEGAPGGREGGPGGGGNRQGGQGGGGGRQGGGPGGAGGPPGGMMKFLPITIALDTDKNGEISADEIANAATALKTLDKNGDGKLTEDELRPSFGPGGGQGGPGGGQGRGNNRQGGGRPGGQGGPPGAGGPPGGGQPGGGEGGGERPRRPE